MSGHSQHLLHLSSDDVQDALNELLREPLDPGDRRAFHGELAHEDWRYSLEAAVRLVGAHCADRDARALLDARVIACSAGTQSTGQVGERAAENTVIPMAGKIAASLVAALRIAGESVNVQDGADYAESLRNLLAGDLDESDLIVRRWHESLVETFAVRGKVL